MPLTPEALLADYPPEVVAVCEALRRLFRETAPEATERAYAGWRGIGFRHPSAGLLGTIFPLADKVTLYFEHGRFLPDPHNILHGEGSQTRQITFHVVSDIPTDALRALVLEAVAYGLARKAARPRKT